MNHDVSDSVLSQLAAQHGTPLYVMDLSVLRHKIDRIKNLSFPYGGTIRYAMKANPHPEVMRLMKDAGISIDASSSYEVMEAIEAGFAPESILLTSQQSAHNLEELVGLGVQYNATSLHQLELFGQASPGGRVSLRLNPGIGSGHSTKVDVGGVTSSFGIWHEQLPEALELAERYDLTVERVHTHIGSGSDPAVWGQTVDITLDLVRRVPTATIVNFGGGFKVARMPDEADTPIEVIDDMVSGRIEAFAVETGRQLHVEFEPGSYFVVQIGTLVARIDDIVTTGPEGYQFVKLDTGMSDILRPALYGARHRIAVLNPTSYEEGDYVITGHNCESTDVLTTAQGQPNVLEPRTLVGAKIGALVAIHDAGAYCTNIRAAGFNSFPPAPVVVVEN